MEYSKPMVTIELQEYNEIKEKAKLGTDRAQMMIEEFRNKFESFTKMYPQLNLMEDFQKYVNKQQSWL